MQRQLHRIGPRVTEEGRPSEGRVRVLHLLKGLGPGGAEVLVASAARVRAADEFDYDVAYILPWKDALFPRLIDAGAGVHCLDCSDARDPRWIWRLLRLIWRIQPDVLHVHSPALVAVALPFLRLLPKGRRPAFVTTEHNVWSAYHPLTRRVNRVALRLSDARLAVSEEVRSSIDRDYTSRVEVMVQGLVLDEIRSVAPEREQVRNELGVGANEIVAMTVANLRAQKCYPDLLAAAAIVKERRPQVRFFAVGQGPLEEALNAEHRRLELGSTFTFLGYRPDALRLLSGCDLFVLPSRFEGYSIAVMEAMALGRPLVVTNVGGMPQATGRGERGVLVDPGRPDELAQAIIDLADDPGRRALLGGKAEAYAARYDIRVAVQRTEQIYRRLAEAHA